MPSSGPIHSISLFDVCVVLCRCIPVATTPGKRLRTHRELEKKLLHSGHGRYPYDGRLQISWKTFFIYKKGTSPSEGQY